MSGYQSTSGQCNLFSLSHLLAIKIMLFLLNWPAQSSPWAKSVSYLDHGSLGTKLGPNGDAMPA